MHVARFGDDIEHDQAGFGERIFQTQAALAAGIDDQNGMDMLVDEVASGRAPFASGPARALPRAREDSAPFRKRAVQRATKRCAARTSAVRAPASSPEKPVVNGFQPMAW